ncbi:hypothetical protein EDD18DRAFT_1339290 [Armillaria luteobubalina]|uniref:Uncharacterized protein n=1 Tax=Armillaria luteobubalina TaxID=153913 RepID=A0AA39NYQ3_9AGAR|nr:hypothetical protein EDD18DRAFT_1339290 [Armillaria luteobubalina]
MSTQNSHERMHLSQNYSQISFNSSKGDEAVEIYKQNETPCENMTSRSLTKSRWLSGVYSQICGAVPNFNIFHPHAPYWVPVLNKAFAPQIEAVSASDHRQVELDRLQKVEVEIARRYGRLSAPFIDSVDLFQVVKDRALKSKDPQPQSDLQQLDKLLKLHLEMKTGALPSVGLIVREPALSAELENRTHFSCRVRLGILMSIVEVSAHSMRHAKHSLYATFEGQPYPSQEDHLEQRDNEQQGSTSKAEARVMKWKASKVVIDFVSNEEICGVSMKITARNSVEKENFISKIENGNLRVAALENCDEEYQHAGVLGSQKLDRNH